MHKVCFGYAWDMPRCVCRVWQKIINSQRDVSMSIGMNNYLGERGWWGSPRCVCRASKKIINSKMCVCRVWQKMINSQRDVSMSISMSNYIRCKVFEGYVSRIRVWKMVWKMCLFSLFPPPCIPAYLHTPEESVAVGETRGMKIFFVPQNFFISFTLSYFHHTNFL